MADRFDAVVVGAGPNGLAAAVELARRGRSVLVVEGEDTIGGGARTAALTIEGFAHDVCSAVHPLAAGSPYFRSLPLADYGLEWAHPQIPLAHPMDHTTVALYRSISDTAGALGADGEAYRNLITPLATRLDELLDDILRPFLRFPRHPIGLARFGLTGMRSVNAITSRFSTPEARALLAGLGAHSIARLDRPLTSGVALVLATAAHVFGFPFARGGSKAITDALAGYLGDLGGRIDTGRWITGLEELPNADAYLLDVSAPAAARIAGDRIKGLTRRRLTKWRHGPGVFKVDYALRAPPPWRDETLAAAGTVHIGGTASDVESSERASVEGSHTSRPFVLLAQPTVADQSRSPVGTHVVWAYCHVPNGSTTDMTEAIEAQIERYAPGFGGRVLARHTRDTSEYETYNPNIVGGDIGGGAFGIRGTILRRPNPYRIGAGVYLCSSATPPGAGVHGMCGYHAARAAARH